MNIAALDLGTTTGWALSNGLYGYWSLGIRRDESGGMRLLRLRWKLQEVQQSFPLDLLVFEAVRYAGRGGAAVVLAEMQGVVKVVCIERDIQWRGYSSSEIKKHATGKGNANKQAMMAAAQAKWPTYKIDTHDVADALWLLDLVQTEAGKDK